MPGILIAIFNMSIVGSAIIIFAFIARFFLRKFSKKYSYILWGIVCLRLICPFGLNFQNILNLLQGKEAGSIISRTEYIPQVIGTAYISPFNTASGAATMMLTFLFVIWALGFIGMVIYEATAYFNASKRLATAIKIQEGIFETDQISTPLIFGVINPKIYVPVGISETELNYALCHELIHIKKKDYIIKLFGTLVLAIHWFNPFVWLAFKYLSIDIEMNCDENVVTALGNNTRKEYAETIFNFSKTPIKVTKSMLTLGASDTRKRVKNILDKKKNTKIGIVIVVIVCIIIGILLLSNSAISSLFGFARDSVSVQEIQRLTTTDLSNITVDNIQIGSDINDVDLSLYEESNRFSGGNYAYYFDRLILDVDGENKINYIFGYNSEVSIMINDQSVMSATIDDIAELLGSNYLDKVQDREQYLRKHIYCDSATGATVEFIYNDYDKHLVWIALQRIKIK